jgi:tetratricopeptide (TPR) repeat protein
MVEASGERAVGLGGSARNVATGDFVQQIDQATVLPAEAFLPVGELPKRLVKLPAPTRLFVGRERELALLDGPSAVVCVHGLGGIGKSTLVAKWAQGSTGDCNPVWWITADTPAAIDAGLTGLGMAMQPELTDVLPQQALRERALQWLATHEGWLVVLDNVSDPAHVEPLLERVPDGRFVITSRRGTGWHGTAVTVDLDVLDTAHAAELFGRICPGGGAGVPELVGELGNLPLAVEQAAAFCRETGISAGRYREMLAAYPADMFAASAEGGDPERTVARVWRVTLDGLAEGDVTPVVLLHVLAWFAPDGIPRSMLEGAAKPMVLARALGRLAAHSMISIEGDTLSVHRLVQAVSRTPGEHALAGPEAVVAARDRAIRLLLMALPEDHEDVSSWPVWRSLLPHAEALADHVAPDEDTEPLGRIMNKAGLFLLAQRDARQALRLLERARATCVRLLGAENRNALSVLSNVAQAHAMVGNFSMAITLLERVCEDGARILGEDAPQLAELRGNLGTVYFKAEDWNAAMKLHERSLEVLRRTVGGDDPRTVRAQGQLLAVLIATGEAKKALVPLRTFVADCVRAYGGDHPATLTARHNLAAACREAGDLEEAVALQRRNTADHERVLGKLHPETLMSLNNLAGMYYRAGRTSEALSLWEQALRDGVRTLGKDHPEMRLVRENLEAARE